MHLDMRTGQHVGSATDIALQQLLSDACQSSCMLGIPQMIPSTDWPAVRSNGLSRTAEQKFVPGALDRNWQSSTGLLSGTAILHFRSVIRSTRAPAEKSDRGDDEGADHDVPGRFCQPLWRRAPRQTGQHGCRVWARRTARHGHGRQGRCVIARPSTSSGWSVQSGSFIKGTCPILHLVVTHSVAARSWQRALQVAGESALLVWLGYYDR